MWNLSINSLPLCTHGHSVKPKNVLFFYNGTSLSPNTYFQMQLVVVTANHLLCVFAYETWSSELWLPYSIWLLKKSQSTTRRDKPSKYGIPHLSTLPSCSWEKTICWVMAQGEVIMVCARVDHHVNSWCPTHRSFATCSMWMYLHRACGIYLAISLLSRLNQVVSPGLNNYKLTLTNEFIEKRFKKEINSGVEKIF